MVPSGVALRTGPSHPEEHQCTEETGPRDCWYLLPRLRGGGSPPGTPRGLRAINPEPHFYHLSVCLSVSLLLSLSLQLRSHILLTPLWTQDLQGELEEPRAYGRASGRFLARAASPCRQAPNASPPMPFSWPILHPIPSSSPPFTGLLPTGQ